MTAMISQHPLQLHLSRYRPGTAMAAHAHDESWLCLVLAGGYEEHIRGRCTQHGPGDLLLCPAQATHRQHFGARGALKVLFAPPAAALDYLGDRGVALAQAPVLRSTPELLRLGTRLRRELELDDAYAPLAAEGLSLELLAALGRADRVTPTVPPWLRRVRERLDDDPAAAHSLAALARLAERHPVHLAKAFRSHYGCTVGDYLRRARADRAAVLLRASRRSLIDIALECGYADAAQFSRSFKAVYGVAPSAYRAALS